MRGALLHHLIKSFLPNLVDSRSTFARQQALHWVLPLRIHMQSLRDVSGIYLYTCALIDVCILGRYT
jgi:hypothetical protein